MVGRILMFMWSFGVLSLTPRPLISIVQNSYKPEMAFMKPHDKAYCKGLSSY